MLKIGNHQKLIVGYDLDWNYAQISYCNAAGSQVETVSSVAGSESFRMFFFILLFIYHLQNHSLNIMY